jgi:hypothetical protein
VISLLVKAQLGWEVWEKFVKFRFESCDLRFDLKKCPPQCFELESWKWKSNLNSKLSALIKFVFVQKHIFKLMGVARFTLWPQSEIPKLLSENSFEQKRAGSWYFSPQISCHVWRLIPNDTRFGDAWDCSETLGTNEPRPLNSLGCWIHGIIGFLPCLEKSEENRPRQGNGREMETQS